MTNPHGPADGPDPHAWGRAPHPGSPSGGAPQQGGGPGEPHPGPGQHQPRRYPPQPAQPGGFGGYQGQQPGNFPAQPHQELPHQQQPGQPQPSQQPGFPPLPGQQHGPPPQHWFPPQAGHRPNPGQHGFPPSPHGGFGPPPPAQPGGFPAQPGPPQHGFPPHHAVDPGPGRFGHLPGHGSETPNPTPRKESRRPLLIGGAGLVLIAVVVAFGGLVWPGWFTVTVFDQAKLQTGVTQILTNDYRVQDLAAVSCPAGQAVTPGSTFSCDATIAGSHKQVAITVKNSDGVYEVAKPA